MASGPEGWGPREGIVERTREPARPHKLEEWRSAPGRRDGARLEGIVERTRTSNRSGTPACVPLSPMSGAPPEPLPAERRDQLLTHLHTSEIFGRFPYIRIPTR